MPGFFFWYTVFSMDLTYPQKPMFLSDSHRVDTAPIFIAGNWFFLPSLKQENDIFNSSVGVPAITFDLKNLTSWFDTLHDKSSLSNIDPDLEVILTNDFVEFFYGRSMTYRLLLNRVKEAQKHIFRFNGNSSVTVFQHSLAATLFLACIFKLLNTECQKVFHLALLVTYHHDNAEAIIGDIPSYLKTDSQRELEEYILKSYLIPYYPSYEFQEHELQNASKILTFVDGFLGFVEATSAYEFVCNWDNPSIENTKLKWFGSLVSQFKDICFQDVDIMTIYKLAEDCLLYSIHGSNEQESGLSHRSGIDNFILTTKT